ncbi:hypothetical protein MMC30_008945 [Trapelia coarctata]|nr:hypothetical protein [Trapelia coarctata]
MSEAMTGVFWGSLSDRVGRKPVLLLGCAGTMLSMLVMGFATNFWICLLGRVLGGLVNGNIAIIQTMVGELVKRPEHEPRAYAVMPFVWSIGTILGPIIGSLANPAKTFPDIFSTNGLFAAFPYLLPNLICAVMLLIGIIVAYFFLTETLILAEQEEKESEVPLIASVDVSVNAGTNLLSENYGTFEPVNVDHEETSAASPNGPYRQLSTSSQSLHKTFSRQVVMLVVALGLYSYHSMAYDHLLPIFLQDDKANDISALKASLIGVPGGLGMSTGQVGIIMAVNGMIALLIQAVIFPILADLFGIWRIFIVVITLFPMAYFMIPPLTALPDNLLYTGIYSALTVRSFFSILTYPVILILLKEACPKPSVLGKINGLAASVGAASRTVAPPVAGLLYALGAEIGLSGLAFWGTGVVAMLGAFQLLWIEREKKKNGAALVISAPIKACSGLKDTIRVVVAEV